VYLDSIGLFLLSNLIIYGYLIEETCGGNTQFEDLEGSPC
jgi:hypothetical protein